LVAGHIKGLPKKGCHVLGFLLFLSPERSGALREARKRLLLAQKRRTELCAALAMQATTKQAKGVYASKIIKAGALLADTKTLLSHWDPAASKAGNLDRFKRENLFSKASRARINDILGIFSQRYLQDEAVLRALIELVKKRLPAEAMDRILYFHACQTDRLLHDLVVDVLYDFHVRGRDEISQNEIRRILSQWVTAGKTTDDWSPYTIQRVTRGLLSTLRDFGVLAGAVNKRLAASFLPLQAFAYVAFVLWQRLRSGRVLLQSDEWRLFILSSQVVERLFLEAHQGGLLQYHAAGSVIRIDFPAQSLEEYAHVIAERPH
jgi:Putative inner membrane protein (DUF1819)